MKEYLKSSEHPIRDINKISYPGQPAKNKMYLPGFESYFNSMPVLRHDNPDVNLLAKESGDNMKNLALQLQQNDIVKNPIPKGDFERYILGLEGNGKEGTEFVLAKWGDGFTSPVHGHAAGFEYEEILIGKILVNTYRMINPHSNLVRLIESKIYQPGTFVNTYIHPGNYKFKRQALIHNFKSIGYSASLHYLSEHTRDGRDNKFEVQYFEDFYNLSDHDLIPISQEECLKIPLGSVVLVRSNNVREYGDHFIIISGEPEQKLHGLRPHTNSIIAPLANRIIDCFLPDDKGVTLLLLNDTAKRYFYKFHEYYLFNNQIYIPNNSNMLSL